MGHHWHQARRTALILAVGCLVLAGSAQSLTDVAADTSLMQVSAVNSWSATLQWSASPQVAQVRIFRGGRLLDDVPFAGGSTLVYTDYLLWPSTTYSYELIALNGGHQVVADLTETVTTPAQAGAFPTPYAPSSFWNQPIPADPVADPNSDAMVSAALTAYAPGANFNNSNEWGKPLAYANTVSELYPVGCTIYDCATPVSFRIPQYATPTAGPDHHLIVVDPSTNTELDMFQANYDRAADAWSAASRFTSGADGWGALCAPGQSCLAAVAAGFAALGGVVRPEEIAQGHIDHALFFVTPYTRAGDVACPATHTDGAITDPAAIPEGAHIQLDPSFDVDGQSWPAWEKVIAHALQTYGAYLGDTGGSLAFAAEPNLDRGYDAWSLAGVAGVAPSIANLPWSSFRVLQPTAC